MKRSRIMIGLGLTALAALIVAIGLASASSNGGGDAEDQPAAVAPTQPPVAPGEDQAPPGGGNAAQPTPVVTNPGLPITNQQPPAPPTIGPDSPVRSGLPPTTPPDSVAPGRPVPVQPTPPPAPQPGTIIVPAPIDKLDVVVRESFPPQYGLAIKAGLPSGCAKPYSHDVTRSGNLIRVSVLNTTVAQGICTLIYGTYDINVDLGSNFQSGVQYTVQVNDKMMTFTAQ